MNSLRIRDDREVVNRQFGEGISMSTWSVGDIVGHVHIRGTHEIAEIYPESQQVLLKIDHSDDYRTSIHFLRRAVFCEWSHDSEHDRWDTGCEDVIALHNSESPFNYGFKYCPYCGKRVLAAESL